MTRDGRGEWLEPMTIEQLRRLFKVSRNTMAKRLRDGTVKAKRFGCMWRIHASERPAQ